LPILPFARALFCATLAGFCVCSAHADFTYTETTQVTGGSLVSMMKTMGTFSKAARQFGQPVESTVIVKGNRMTRITADRTEIIDLDKGTITSIDNAKHQYTVLTFEQMKQRMDEAVARAKSQQAKQPAAQPQASTDAQLKFTVKVRNTDATKEVAGLNAREAIMVMSMDATSTQAPGQTATMGITSDLWLAPEIPGYKEVRDFYTRMAEKMGSTFGAGSGGEMATLMAQMPPGAVQGMADMAKEMQKLKGVPVQTIMRMGTTANGTPIPAASEGPLPEGPPPPSAGDMARQGAASAIASSIPFGLGRKKKADPPPAAVDSSAPAGPVVMMETTTQLSSFSSNAVDPSRFAVPAGYKQIELKNE
jgi:hypothetical protein